MPDFKWSESCGNISYAVSVAFVPNAALERLEEQTKQLLFKVEVIDLMSRGENESFVQLKLDQPKHCNRQQHLSMQCKRRCA